MSGSRTLLVCLLFAAVFRPGLLAAANEPALVEDLYQPGHGSVTLAVGAIEVHEFNTSVSDVDIGSVSTRSAYVELEYAVSSRWLLSVALPYIRKDYDGPARHDPLTLDPPRPEVPYLDDGNWHGNLQDVVFGAHYLLDTRPLQIEPFAYVVVPTHDYPHFAQAAVGQNLWKVELGVEATHFLPFSDWYYRAATSYTIVEETLGVNINHFRLYGELGYFLGPTLAAHVFFTGKHGRGDDGTEFPPSQRTDERWYQHDRTSRHSFLNVGVGTDWYFHENYQLSCAWLTSVWGKTVHLVDYSFTVGITRYF